MAVYYVSGTGDTTLNQLGKKSLPSLNWGSRRAAKFNWQNKSVKYLLEGGYLETMREQVWKQGEQSEAPTGIQRGENDGFDKGKVMVTDTCWR